MRLIIIKTLFLSLSHYAFSQETFPPEADGAKKCQSEVPKAGFCSQNDHLQTCSK
jgi:hypothetical protein